MHMKDNTVLITGGGSGIGRALAEQFYGRGNQVIIAGRRQEALDEVTAANPGMAPRTLDVQDAGAVQSFAAGLVADFPALNVVIHNAGIMRPEVIQQAEVGDAEAIIATNLLGPIRLTAALLPHLQKQPRATLITVSSGLAFLPMALTPTYNATKAAIHSYTQSLRYQLQETSVEVTELIPPAVQTELMGPQQASNPNYMPLDEYISETMTLLETSPGADEILVERVKPLRFAEVNGGYDAFFKKFNDGVSGA